MLTSYAGQPRRRAVAQSWYGWSGGSGSRGASGSGISPLFFYCHVGARVVAVLVFGASQPPRPPPPTAVGRRLRTPARPLLRTSSPLPPPHHQHSELPLSCHETSSIMIAARTAGLAVANLARTAVLPTVRFRVHDGPDDSNARPRTHCVEPKPTSRRDALEETVLKRWVYHPSVEDSLNLRAH